MKTLANTIKKNQRLNLSFSPEAISKLDHLVKSMDANGYAEVIRRCLCYGIWIEEQKSLRREIASVEGDKIIHTVKFL